MPYVRGPRPWTTRQFGRDRHSSRLPVAVTTLCLSLAIVSTAIAYNATEKLEDARTAVYTLKQESTVLKAENVAYKASIRVFTSAASSALDNADRLATAVRDIGGLDGIDRVQGLMGNRWPKPRVLEIGWRGECE